MSSGELGAFAKPEDIANPRAEGTCDALRIEDDKHSAKLIISGEIRKISHTLTRCLILFVRAVSPGIRWLGIRDG
jgi:hypothetical protein